MGAIATGPWVVVKPDDAENTQPTGSDDFESVGEILRRMRGQCESEMTGDFSHGLSLRLDLCLALEQCTEEGRL